MNWIRKFFRFPFTDIRKINRQIFNLPIKDVSDREIIYNKHMQNLVWMFWFGKALHLDNKKEII
jgi:hypothetical protein